MEKNEKTKYKLAEAMKECMKTSKVDAITVKQLAEKCGLTLSLIHIYADWTKALMYMCELTFSVAMTVGAVKGAQGLTSKALGL